MVTSAAWQVRVSTSGVIEPAAALDALQELAVKRGSHDVLSVAVAVFNRAEAELGRITDATEAALLTFFSKMCASACDSSHQSFRINACHPCSSEFGTFLFRVLFSLVSRHLTAAVRVQCGAVCSQCVGW